MIVHYAPQIGTNNNGRVAISFTEDADSGTPTNMSNLMEMKQSVEMAGFQRGRLVVRPHHEEFLWTGDLTLNEDRLEYPGVLYVASASFGATYTPGYIWVEAVTEWDSPTNTTVGVSRLLNFAKRVAESQGPAKIQTTTEQSRETSDDDGEAYKQLLALAARLSVTGRTEPGPDGTVAPRNR